MHTQGQLRAVWATMGLAAAGAVVLDALVFETSQLWQPHVLTLPFFSFALLGIYVIFVANALDARLRAGVVIPGVVLPVLFWTVTGVPDAALFWMMDALGATCLLCLLWEALGHAAPRGHRLLLSALLLPIYVWISQPFLQLTPRLAPEVLDHVLYAVDATYGLQPSFAIGRLFDASPTLAVASKLAYASLPAMLALVYGLRERAGDARAGEILAGFVFVGVTGYCVYLLFPVIGPEPAFPGHFPHDPPAVGAATPNGAPGYPRNCVPSLHTAWALLVVWHARSLARPWRGLVWPFFVLNELATLGLGAHYLYDLVIALPFALAVHAATLRGAPAAARRMALAAGAGIFVAWIVLAFAGLPLLAWSPVLVWAATLATAALCWHLELRLWREPAVPS